MDAIKADNTVIKATVTYPPSMASSAIKLARLIAQGKGMSDLVEPDVPALDHPVQRDRHQGERRPVPADRASSPEPPSPTASTDRRQE